MTKIESGYRLQCHPFGETKDIVRARRGIKRESHVVNLAGRKGERLEKIIQSALSALDSMQETHKDWIDDKIQQILPYFIGSENTDKAEVDNPRSRIEDAFRRGLVTTLTQEWRVSRGSERVNSSQGLTHITIGYAFDFYRTLRVCQRAGVNSNTALDIARLSYHYNPNILIKLGSSPPFRDLNDSVIEKAVLKCPSDPKSFLKRFNAKVKDLSTDPRYQDFCSCVIERAVLNFPDEPRIFLDRYSANVNRLSTDPRYKNLLPGVIRSAVLDSPGDPEKRLDKYVENVNRLSKSPRYQNLLPSVIRSIAFSSPGDPEKRLDKYIEDVNRLSTNPRYQNLLPGVIRSAALGSPGDPEAFLDKYIENVNRLSTDPHYQNLLPNSSIRRAALYYHEDPEAYLNDLIQKRSRD